MSIDYSKIAPLRNFARQTGLVWLLSLPSHWKRSQRKFEYERTKPTVAIVGFDNLSVQMRTENLYEWMRAQSFHDDQHIISAAMRQLRPGDNCWDIGASIGLYSALFGKAVGVGGQVVSFEPENRSREKLLANIALNELKNIRVFPVALGREKGQFDLELATAASAGTHRLVTSGHSEKKENVQQVEVWSGDEFRAANQLSVPNMIKVDVEGQEENVLLGLKDTLADLACKAVVCEVHFSILAANGDDGAPKRIMELLKSCGFKQQNWIDASHLAAYK
ncbi:MAG: FkbM family methyltransferase [Saprospiraceae bacterium]|nr:FkbM family methyltransferase [Saprospiraceae bacterium]